MRAFRIVELTNGDYQVQSRGAGWSRLFDPFWGLEGNMRFTLPEARQWVAHLRDRWNVEAVKVVV